MLFLNYLLHVNIEMIMKIKSSNDIIILYSSL